MNSRIKIITYAFISLVLLGKTAHAVQGDPADNFRTGTPPSPIREVIHATPQNIQQVLDDAQLGDVIELSPGLSYPPIQLPKKETHAAASQWITIRSSAEIPAGRITLDDAELLATIATDGSKPAIETEDGASYYWLMGLEVRPTDSASSNKQNLIVIGNASSQTEQADHIVLDRDYIHGNTNAEWRRGVAMNGTSIAIMNSIISEIHTWTYPNGQKDRYEAQAIASWNGKGPYRIVNNFISASTQEILFGGATSCSEAMIPSDIEISNNHFYKPLSWKSNANPHWWVKNHIEIKSARRVTIENNMLENNWKDSDGDQNGAAILLAPMNQVYGGVCNEEVTDNPWSQVTDISILNNKIFNAGQGINISASDTEHPSKTTKNIAIKKNAFYGSGRDNSMSPDTSENGFGNGTLILVVTHGGNIVDGLTIQENTAFQNAGFLVFDTYPQLDLSAITPNKNVVIHDNVFNWQYKKTNTTAFRGVAGSGTPEGDATFAVYAPDAVFAGNTIMRAAPEGTALYEKHNVGEINTFTHDWKTFTDSDSVDPNKRITPLFPDISNSNYRASIEYLKQRGIIDGNPDGTFKPTKILNRAEMATILVSEREKNPVARRDCFKDIDSISWYSAFVCRGKELGIVAGYPDGFFRAAQPVNFAEALLMMQRTHDIPVTTPPGPLWYEESQANARTMKIVPETLMHPADLITRAEAADILAHLLKLKGF